MNDSCTRAMVGTRWRWQEQGTRRRVSSHCGVAHCWSKIVCHTTKYCPKCHTTWTQTHTCTPRGLDSGDACANSHTRRMHANKSRACAGQAMRTAAASTLPKLDDHHCRKQTIFYSHTFVHIPTHTTKRHYATIPTVWPAWHACAVRSGQMRGALDSQQQWERGASGRSARRA